MGETIGNAVAAGAGRLPRPGDAAQRRRPEHPDPPGARGRLRSWAAARRAAAARWTPCWPPTGWAPGSPGGTCARAPCATGLTAEQLARVRRAGVRLHRRAVGGQRRRAHRRAGHHRPGPAALPGAAGRAPARRRSRPTRSPRPPSGPTGTPPRTLTAVLLPEAQVRGVLGSLDARTLALDRGRARAPTSAIGLLLVPDADGRGPAGAAALAARRDAVVGPGAAVAGRCRAPTPGRCRALQLGSALRSGTVDTEQHGWPTSCCAPTPEALADLRAAVLAPLADLRPSAAREADRDAALLAAAPRPAGGDRRRRCSCTRRPCATG